MRAAAIVVALAATAAAPGCVEGAFDGIDITVANRTGREVTVNLTVTDAAGDFVTNMGTGMPADYTETHDTTIRDDGEYALRVGIEGGPSDTATFSVGRGFGDVSVVLMADGIDVTQALG